MDRVITISSLTVDLDRIRAIKLNNFSGNGNSNVLTIEYNSRIEYTKNPFTHEIEKTIIVETITKEYPDFETARLYQTEFEECWKEYINDK
jgi:hypothetical protein